MLREGVEAGLGEARIVNGSSIEFRPRSETKLVDLAKLLEAWPHRIVHLVLVRAVPGLSLMVG